MKEKELIKNIISIINTTDDDYTDVFKVEAFYDIKCLVEKYLYTKKESPYIEEITTIERCNPKFGDDKKCKCRHKQNN